MGVTGTLLDSALDEAVWLLFILSVIVVCVYEAMRRSIRDEANEEESMF